MNIYLGGILLSILVYLLIGIYAGRKVHTLEDYYVCGRNAPTLLIAGTLFASMLSTNGFMGDAAYAYGGNITTMILINVLCGCGYVFGGLFFGRYIRRAKANTMPTYFGERFNSVRLRRLAGITTIVALTTYLLAVLQATSILMEMLTGLGHIQCLFMSLACIIVFAVYSGSQGVLLTDTVMFLLFIGATLLAGPYIFEAAGGLSELIPNLASNPNTPEGLLDYHGNTGGGSVFDIMLYGVNIGVMWFIAVGVSPWQCGRNLMAKSEHVILRSGTVAAILSVVFLTYLYIMAISVNLLNPDMAKPEQVLIWAAFETMPKIVGVLLMTGIMAAGLSSASTFLSVISFSLSSDVFKFSFTSDAQRLRFSRWIMFGMGIFTTGLACFDLSSIRIISWVSSTVIAASWAYVSFASVWSKTLTERGAFYAMLGGFAGFFIPKILHETGVMAFKNLLDPFFIALATSIVCGIAFSRNQQRSEKEIAFFNMLHRIPQEETLAADYRKDKVYGWAMIAIGIILAIVFIVYWALPYNALRV